jgi:PAS domain S-box-containing protein
MGRKSPAPPVKDAEGATIGSVSVTRGATGRNKAEQAICESEQQLAAFFDNAPVIVWVKDLEGRFLRVNRYAERTLGKSAEEFVGRTVADLYPGAEADPYTSNDQKVIAAGAAMEFREQLALADGPHTFQVFKFPLRDAAKRICGIGAICNDVTARVQAETARREAEQRLQATMQALRESEGRLQLTLQASAVGTFEVDLTTGVGRWNAVERELLGLKPGEGQEGPEAFFSYVHPEDVAGLRAQWEEAMRTGMFDAEFRVIRADGQERWLAGRGQFAFADTDTGGGGGRKSPVRFQGVNYDITDRKQAEEALREREQLLRDIIDTIPDPIYVKDSSSRLTLANAATLAAVGKPAEAIVGHTDREFYDDAGIGESILDHDRQVMEAGTTHLYEETIHGPHGHRVMLNTKVPRRDTSGRVVGLVGIARDITDRKRAEEALREARDYLQSLIGYANAPIIVWDPGFCITQFNRAFERLSGRKADEVLGRTLDILFPTDRREESMSHIRRTTTGERWEVVEIPIQHVDGSVRTVLWNSATIFAADGKTAVATIAQGQDITERKQAEEALRESHARLKRVLEVETVGVMFWDLGTGRMTDANDTFLKLMGYSRHEVEEGELTWQKLTPPEYVEASLAEISKFKASGRIGPYEKEYLRKDGTRHWFVFAGSSLGGNACVEFCVDISDRKLTEDALRAANIKLAEADRRKDEFLATLSHELRNPLAPISNSLYVLDRAAPGGPQAKRAKEVIDRQVAHLSRLVNDLLDVTRISRNKIQLQRAQTDLCDIVRRSVEDQRSLFDGSQLKLETDIPRKPVFVNADTTRISQIVGNLLQNAAKFTRAGGRTRVGVSADRPRGQAVVRVSDTGAGMNAETIAGLFQPFVQADHTLDRTSGGLGLGLALVKGLVELHGGEASAHSDGLGKGAEFVVRLPLMGAVEPRAELAQAPPPPPTRILLIEDNIDAAESLRGALELSGHEVLVAHDGPGGIALARDRRPAFVFCDIGLPRMDGYAVARAFRGDQALKDVHLVALSGYALPEDVQRSTEAGFEQHLAKPPSLAALAAILGDAHGKRFT